MDGAREPARSFQDVEAWQRAHTLALSVYPLTDGFPRSEQFGLTSQLRRAAVSVAANIAEGFTRRSDAEKLRYLDVARGSLEECRYYLILCRDLAYAGPQETEAELDRASRVLARYAAPIRQRLRE